MRMYAKTARIWAAWIAFWALAVVVTASACAADRSGADGNGQTADKQASTAEPKSATSGRAVSGAQAAGKNKASGKAGASAGDVKAKVLQNAPAAAAGKSSKQGRPAGGSHSEKPFSYDTLVSRAQALAGNAYQPPARIPQFLAKLGSQKRAQIHFKRDDALWHARDKPFQVMFYHPGAYYDHAVTIHVVKADGTVDTVPFDKDDFVYPDPALAARVPADLGYAGFKILHTLGHANKLDEVLSFLGASYFRALGADEHYGLSARGLAIDTGNTQKGEEFPNFTAFWLAEPSANAGHITIYALLNSPSVTGAYQFVLTPGEATHTHVEETLFTRKAIDKLGIAPLTSMFGWGENSLARLADYRPEAHDSDGMLISSANGEWLWRPLVNPQKLWMNDFDANSVRGFGLMQRDRDFSDYQDLTREYEKRPNAWVTPEGNWGDGHLELVEIPSNSEVNDNISLYWVPKAPVQAGARLHFAYDIKWSREPAIPNSLGHTVATRVGMAAVAPGQQKSQVRVAIDFVGGELSKLRDPNSVQPKVNAGRDVTLNNIQAVRNPHTDGWRLSFLVPTSALDKPLELRAYLADANGGGLTETWSYQLALP